MQTHKGRNSMQLRMDEQDKGREKKKLVEGSLCFPKEI